VNPFQGIDSPTDVEGAELTDLKSQSNIAGSVMDYKEQGNKIELMGQEKVEGVNTYKLQLTAKEDGRITTYYIDASKYEMVKSVTSRELMGQNVDVETVFSNPKTFAGLKFYMTRVQSINGSVYQSITLSNVELNVQVDEKIFNK
jgi:outer membrane lipoprotein-sorting protein